ncbi:hypothetical protein [Halobaculum magnesiiphilum]|uniref:Uncharacterized protein n=1 Tax=Halobaculum magnesiiphilum TaxID=1017351 RepID=A0A8T8WHD0_9EURY|nr:hypothetical protein [Halobaculum magnesiiphilum]QZP39250.1 hypothetical protein K6T50_16480 [Halobaculum magnesiiphilum]
MTQRTAKLIVALGSGLTVVLTFDAAWATVVTHARVLLITLYIVLAMLSAFTTFMSYEFLRRRRVMLAEQGINPQQ